MQKDKQLIRTKDKYIETLEYNDCFIPIFLDSDGQSYYAIINNKAYGFGAYNSWYEKDVVDLLNILEAQ